MDFAIIKSGEDNLLTVIKLRDWESYQWDSFHTLKSREDDDIDGSKQKMRQWNL